VDDSPLLDEIKSEQLALYLRLRGWSQRAYPSDSVIVLSEPGDADSKVEVVVPRSRELSDYRRRMADAIDTLVALENKSPAQLLLELKTLNRDILCISLDEPVTDGSSISLDIAAKLTDLHRDLLSAAATTELSPRPYFERTVREAARFAENCRFGHTFHGSFGLSIESPVPLRTQLSLSDIDDAPPFERRVLERIVRGFNTIASAGTSSDLELLVSGYGSGLSANMCERLAEVSQVVHENPVRYSVSWSSQWRPAPDVKEVRRFELMPESSKLLASAARAMRVPESSHPLLIRGPVIALRSEANPAQEIWADEDDSEASDMEITVKWTAESGAELRVHVALQPEEYRAACEAHKQGRVIEVRGILEKVRRYWRLGSVRDFRVV
jgi:hypothetical protein